MKSLAVLLLTGILTGCAVSAATQSGDLPPAFAPGATNPAVTQANLGQTVCVPGWTATVRPPVSYTSALKRRQMATLGEADPSAYEEDHRTPLSSGGAPMEPRNLYPELWSGPHGAHAKDTIELQVLHDLCSGRTTLTQAQAFWMGDFWTTTVP
jgi:hypothetical protein